MTQVDIVTPSGWSAGWYGAGRPGTFGALLSLGPSSWTIGIEFITPKQGALGFAIVIGPIWLGIARLNNNRGTRAGA